MNTYKIEGVSCTNGKLDFVNHITKDWELHLATLKKIYQSDDWKVYVTRGVGADWDFAYWDYPGVANK